MLRSLTADDGPGAELKVPDSGTVVVGRAPLADLPLPDHNSVKGLISRKHVSMQLLADGSIAVTDLGSLNGTWVTAAGQHKPQRLQAHVTTAVAPGSTLYFGGHEVVADAEGGRCPNPFVYLYLGPSGGAQQQDFTQHKRQECESVAVQQGAKRRALGDARDVVANQQQQQRPQPAVVQLKQQPEQPAELLPLPNHEWEPSRQQHSPSLHCQQEQEPQQLPACKRPRLLESQRYARQPELPDEALGQLLARADPCHSSVADHCAASVQQVQQQQHHSTTHQVQHRQQCEQQHQQQVDQYRDAAAASAAGLHPHHPGGALAQLDSNVPSSAQAVLYGASQGGHTLQGAAAAAAGALAAAAGGSTSRLDKHNSNTKPTEMDKDLRQISSSNLDCAVCKDLLAAAHVLGCGHMFCGTCLAAWLELKHDPTCPGCRAPVTSVPVRLFRMDCIVAEAELSQGSESQERAARLQQWDEIREATYARWQERFQPDNSTAKPRSKRGRPAGADSAAHRQPQPLVPVGVVPLLGTGTAATIAAGRQRNFRPAHQAVASRRLAAPGAAAAAAGTGGGGGAGLRAGQHASGVRQHSHSSRRVSAPQPAAASRPAVQLHREGVQLARNLRQVDITAFINDTAAEGRARR